MFQMIGATAEFERELIRERVIDGVANARAKGKRTGRKGVAPIDIKRNIGIYKKDKVTLCGVLLRFARLPQLLLLGLSATTNTGYLIPTGIGKKICAVNDGPAIQLRSNFFINGCLPPDWSRTAVSKPHLNSTNTIA